jgi:site-specific DNA-methyltransferase (adenine-specific)
MGRNVVKLLNIDCMEYMRSLPDKSFDLCITSPPYNMNLRINARGDGYCSRQIVKELSTKYENYRDNMPMQDYEKFLSGFIAESVRVSEMVFLNIQQITGNKPAIFNAVAQNSSNLKETIIWDKCVAQPSIADGVLNSQFEFIFVFGGNPIARQFNRCNFAKGAESNIWKIPTEKRAILEHGAGFPLALPKKIIQMFGFDGCKVIDPFLGTGTTAIAAYYAGFDFVGCELDAEYYKSACKRFERETAQQALF